MIHKEFWGLVFLAVVVWIFIAGTPMGRIERFCSPISWTGNVVVSMAALVSPDYQVPTQKWFGKFEYGCQYVTWRVIYQKDYNEYMLKNQGQKPPAQTPNGAVAPPVQPASAAASA